ncbi:MAG: helix-turn-helix transcriptional regulator [Calditrichaeota bacterium]|nr:helix-turn-helix transcriptional regulator [Calditrichota bacterium]
MNLSQDICSVEIINREKVNRVNRNLTSLKETRDMAGLLKSLADPTRLRIVQALLLEELCVCDISAIVNVSISAISHQLRLLRNMRIVKFRKQGKQVFYSLDDEHIAQLVQTALEHVSE